MKNAFYSVLFLCLMGLSATPSYSSAQTLPHDTQDSFFCEWLGWLVQPIGFCTPDIVTTIIPDEEVVNKIDDEQKLAIATTEFKIAEDTVPFVQAVTTETEVYTGYVSEGLLNKRIVEVLTYVNSLPHDRQSAIVSNSVVPETVVTDSSVTREYLLKSLDKVSDQISDSRSDSSVVSSFDSPTLTNSTLNGTTYLSGWLGVGTTSPSDVLSINGPIYLSSVTPTDVTNRIYNNAGSLYWNGSVIAGTSSSAWSESVGDVFRLTGNVGIGTSSSTETLTVAGTFSAGTTTARIQDTGGQVCNVNAYGAVGDNSTDNHTAIMDTIAACPDGGVVFFPMGEYRITEPIVLDKPVTFRGSFSPRWSYNSSHRSSIKADFGSFSGVALVHIRDQTISGAASGNNGGRFENISIDGGSASTNVHGLYFEGLVKDWKITDVDISQVTGNGFLAEVGAGSGNPRGFTIRGLSIYSADGHGFRATALNDSYLEDVLTVGNALRGFYLSSIGETKLNNSRAAFNALEGLYIDGSTNNGGLQITDFSTDRNDRHGVRISATGTTTITFSGLLTRRDGANVGGGTETPYAGLAVIGTTTTKAAPVIVNGLAQTIGVDDAGAPPLAPSVGVRVTNASYVKVDGQLWGVDNAYLDGGGNQVFVIEEDSIVKVGNVGVTENAPPLYNNKWVAATNTKSLLYEGAVSIGSSTGSRLLNITAPSQSGARFTDTTNNVIFDMRAEDYQGFFGTFSNHQLRFQTNNNSRLTIDTNGYVGIGTTSPDQILDVIGTIQASSLLGGAVNLTTDANGNIIRDPSDARLKTNVRDIEDGLEKVLKLRGVSYEWKDTDRFGDQTEIGFISQEVDQVVPEVVRKGGEYWALNTRNLLAVVVDSIQEIWQKVSGNSQQIRDLEDRITDLESIAGVVVVDDEVEVVSDSENEVMTDSEEDSQPEPGENQEDIVFEEPVTVITSSSSATSSEVEVNDEESVTDMTSTSTEPVDETLVDDVSEESDPVLEEDIVLVPAEGQAEEVLVPEIEISSDTASST